MARLGNPIFTAFLALWLLPVITHAIPLMGGGQGGYSSPMMMRNSDAATGAAANGVSSGLVSDYGQGSQQAQMVDNTMNNNANVESMQRVMGLASATNRIRPQLEAQYFMNNNAPATLAEAGANANANANAHPPAAGMSTNTQMDQRTEQQPDDTDFLREQPLATEAKEQVTKSSFSVMNPLMPSFYVRNMEVPAQGVGSAALAAAPANAGMPTGTNRIGEFASTTATQSNQMPGMYQTSSYGNPAAAAMAISATNMVPTNQAASATPPYGSTNAAAFNVMAAPNTAAPPPAPGSIGAAPVQNNMLLGSQWSNPSQQASGFGAMVPPAAAQPVAPLSSMTSNANGFEPASSEPMKTAVDPISANAIPVSAKTTIKTGPSSPTQLMAELESLIQQRKAVSDKDLCGACAAIEIALERFAKLHEMNKKTDSANRQPVTGAMEAPKMELARPNTGMDTVPSKPAAGISSFPSAIQRLRGSNAALDEPAPIHGSAMDRFLSNDESQEEEEGLIPFEGAKAAPKDVPLANSQIDSEKTVAAAPGSASPQ